MDKEEKLKPIQHPFEELFSFFVILNLVQDLGFHPMRQGLFYSPKQCKIKK
jgi:hypothetical protein